MSMSKAWRETRVTIMLMICRIAIFVWIYCYHDWEALVMLLWITHSFIFTNSLVFYRMTSFFYLPLITAIFVMQYTTNIYGVYLWDEHVDTIQNYNYGLF